MLKSMLQPALNSVMNGAFGVGFFLRDTFSSANGTTIFAHTGEHGYSWINQPFNTATTPAVMINGRVRGAGANNVYYLNYPMPSPNYKVKSVFRVFSTLGIAGVTARASSSDNTYYVWRYRDSFAGWELQKRIAGVQTTLATFSRPSIIGEDIEAVLQCKTDGGITTVTGFINGVPRAVVVDNSITVAGRAGLTLQWGVADNTGLQADEFTVELV